MQPNISGKIVVHRGRAHVDDFLASCVCIHKTDLPLFRMDADETMLKDASCWVLDQGLKFEPEFLNFDHHQLDKKICSLTMVLDYFYGETYRTHLPQLAYIEIHDSVGSSKAAKFAGISYEGLEIASSMIQHLLLKAFSRIEGRVNDPFYSIMSSMGGEICGRIEELPVLLGQLDSNARLIEFSGLKILDVTGCDVEEFDKLPTKSWCEQKGMSPAVILTKDGRRTGHYRMVSVDKSIRFSKNLSCEYTHPSGFLTVFADLKDWEDILGSSVSHAP